MTNQNSSSGSSSMAVPEAKAAMNRFKEEVASELGVPLKDGYNGDLTSKQAGSIGAIIYFYIKSEEINYFGSCETFASCYTSVV